MAKEKQRGTVEEKGKKKITTTGKGKENSCPSVQVLRERNIGVVIRDEQDINLMRLHAGESMATEKQKGTVADKGKKKITTAGKGKENSCPVVPNNNVPSKVALAQRARRDRERNERLCSATPRERGQQLRRERERIIQPLESIHFPLQEGESAGANIAHNMAMRFGSEKLDGVELKGIVLIHPYFLLKEPTRSLLAVNEEMRNNITKLWPYVCPSTSGPSDPRVNPVADPDLKKLVGKRVLICLAEQDPLLDAGKKYGQALRREGGKVVKKFVSKGKSHVFHLREPNSKEALDLIDRVASFVNGKSKKTQLGIV